eukprot:scaffold43705_cov61-Phaeocystis_antarctica.AAC.1
MCRGLNRSAAARQRTPPPCTAALAAGMAAPYLALVGDPPLRQPHSNAVILPFPAVVEGARVALVGVAICVLTRDALVVEAPALWPRDGATVLAALRAVKLLHLSLEVHGAIEGIVPRIIGRRPCVADPPIVGGPTDVVEGIAYLAAFGLPGRVEVDGVALFRQVHLRLGFGVIPLSEGHVRRGGDRNADDGLAELLTGRDEAISQRPIERLLVRLPVGVYGAGRGHHKAAYSPNVCLAAALDGGDVVRADVVRRVVEAHEHVLVVGVAVHVPRGVLNDLVVAEDVDVDAAGVAAPGELDDVRAEHLAERARELDAHDVALHGQAAPDVDLPDGLDPREPAGRGGA